MATREEILNGIRNALSNERPNASLPPVPEVWPVEGLSPDALLEKFGQNLTAAAGEIVRCSDRSDAAEKIAERLAALREGDGAEKSGPFKWGIQPGELTEAVAEAANGRFAEKFAGRGFALERIFRPENPEDADPKRLEAFSASLVGAEFLLADTGSAAIRARSAFERLCCYLSPVCFVAAKKSALREHLPQAWAELGGSLKNDERPNGEFLLMTGPSRTADIEKILILGVHGQKKVVLFVIENE